LLIAVILFSSSSIAQDKLYLLFEFMKVDNAQENAYKNTENFWEKIHAQRIKNGDIQGWDLWSLKPGGEDQGYQYLTVQLFNDPVKMFGGGGNLMAATKKAYPDMSEGALLKKLNESSKSRDLAVRYYLVQIDNTKDDFAMPLGTVASINFMKVATDKYDKYENAESKIFKPFHQKSVGAGQRGNWGLLRIMSPMGSDTYASHLTVDMYKDFKQFFAASNNFASGTTPAQQKAINDGLATRDLKWSSIATLIKKAR